MGYDCDMLIGRWKEIAREIELEGAASPSLADDRGFTTLPRAPIVLTRDIWEFSKVGEARVYQRKTTIGPWMMFGLQIRAVIPVVF